MASGRGRNAGAAQEATWLRRGLREIGDALRFGLYPGRCGACGAPPYDGDADDDGLVHGSLCPPCRTTLVPLDANRCPRCARPRPGLLGATATGLCGPCRREPPPWSAERVGFEYGGAVADAIRHFKYHGRPELAAALVRELLAAAGEDRPAADLLVPVPLHLRRLRSRGFNHAARLAAELRRRWDLPLCSEALARTRDTRPQALQPTASARRQNVAGAFVVRRPRRVRGRDVLLVDDVVTTGATATACARALRIAGARRVLVCAIARG